MPNRQNQQAILDFLLFLNDTLSRTSQKFENETTCSPDEANLLFVLSKQGPLKVKELAEALHGMNSSKLTRLLNGLEKQGCVTRTINPDDQRSFLIRPTPAGIQLLEQFTGELSDLAGAMIMPLTTTEQTALIELFDKIRNNWNSSNAHE